MEITEMFREIKKYHKALGYDHDFKTSTERMKEMRDHALALNQEVAELVNCFPWKPWRDVKKQPWETEHAIEEIVDIFFFLGAICEIAYIFPESLETAFKKKLQENYKRIEEKYNNTPDERR